MSTKRRFLLGAAAVASLPIAALRSAKPAGAAAGGDMATDRKLDKLAERVQRLEDDREIRKLQAKYAHYLFTQRFDRIYEECFAKTRDDISTEFSDSGVYKGQDSVRELYHAFQKTKEIPGFFIMHMLVNPYLDIAEDGMSASAHWLSPGITGSNDSAGWVFGPYYVDYVKENGEWRMLHTRLAPIVRTDFNTSWAEATDNGTVRGILGVEPDAPTTLYRPYHEMKKETHIFRNHPDLPDL